MTGIFAGERFAVVGLGRNGSAAAQALSDGGAEVGVWDDDLRHRAATTFPLLPQPFNLRGYTALVLSPGIPHALPAPHEAAEAARRARVPIVSDAELLYVATRRRGSTARFAGITGTNGKSTTTALLHHMLHSAGWDSAAGGNLGTAALALPELGGGGVYVLEMSSYMLERLHTLRFDVACLLNLSPDHIDRHGTMDGYAAAKQHIFDRQEATDTAVLGVDDAATASIAPNRPVILRISGTKKADIWCEDGVLHDAAGELLPMSEAPNLPGTHNAQNAAAAAGMAMALGLRREHVVAGLRSFPGLAHRQQTVATVGGIPWVNDSKATNADATAKALECYQKIVWIVGGLAKDGGIESLRPLFPRIAHALVIGRDGPMLSSTLRSARVPFTISTTLDSAAASARAMAARVEADVVLLSPACASFDQFSGFEARGDRFAELARAAAVREGA